LVERWFAHVCDTGGRRRTWLRGLENVRTRPKLLAAAHNLGLYRPGLILRKLLGARKPRAFSALGQLLRLFQNAQLKPRPLLDALRTAKLYLRAGASPAQI